MLVTVEKSHPYPTWVIAGCETALVIFAAEFGGMNDCAWIVDAGLRATCVDNNPDKLEALRDLYPDDWSYICTDAYSLPSTIRYDVVSLDPFTNQFDRCAGHIDLWCQIAKRAVILGTGTDTQVMSPAGWIQTDCVKRTDYQGGVFWTVLEPT